MFLVLFLFIFFRYIRINYNILWTLNKLKTPELVEESDNGLFTLNICIPCLREQNIIEKTITDLLSCFKTVNVRIYIVTTSKENSEKKENYRYLEELAWSICEGEKSFSICEKYNHLFDREELIQICEKHQSEEFKEVLTSIQATYLDKKTTYESVLELIKINNWKNVILLEEKNDTGCMASQVNYCWKSINNERIEKSPNDYFMVYNADCKPSADLEASLVKEIKENEFPDVLQLIRVYTLNYSQYSGMIGYYLKGSALYQSRWSLGYEYPMLKRTSDSWKKKSFMFKLRSRYMIGHGMTFRMDFYGKMGKLNEKTNLEDLYTGYLLSCLNIPIIPVLAIDNTLNPSTIYSLFNQKMTWFSGMFDVFNYKNYYKKNHKKNYYRLRSYYFTICFLIRDTLSWLFGPSILMICLLLSFTKLPYFLLLSTLIATNVCFCLLLQHQLMKRNLIDEKRYNWLFTAIGVILYSFTRNLPALTFILNKIKIKNYKKYKTDR